MAGSEGIGEQQDHSTDERRSQQGMPTFIQYWNALAPRPSAASRHDLRRPSTAGVMMMSIGNLEIQVDDRQTQKLNRLKPVAYRLSPILLSRLVTRPAEPMEATNANTNGTPPG